jgi:hypothetical protein
VTSEILEKFGNRPGQDDFERMHYRREVDENFDNSYFLNDQTIAICAWALCKNMGYNSRFEKKYHKFAEHFSVKSLAIMLYSKGMILWMPNNSFDEFTMIRLY